MSALAPAGHDPDRWWLVVGRLEKLAERARLTPAVVAARLERLALRASDPKLHELVELADEPLDLDDADPDGDRPLEEPYAREEPLAPPAAWPRPGETEEQHVGRLEYARTLTASGDHFELGPDGTWTPISRGAVEAARRHERAAPTYRKPPRPYRIGRHVARVDLVNMTVTDRHGRPVPGVRIAPDGKLVASAPPAPVEAAPAETTDASGVLAFARDAFETMKALARRPIKVHVEQQPAPVIHVAAPDLSLIPAPVVNVTVERPRPRSVRVEYDDRGDKVYRVEDDA